MLWGGRLWRHPDFLKLWGGQTISQIGSQLTVLALPTVAVLQLHRGAFEVGILIALQRIPFPLLALIAGVWVDRVRRRPLMIVADVLRALALASIPIAAVANVLTLLQLYAVALLMGIGSVLFDIAYLAYLPSLVGPAELLEGNTKLEVTFSVAGLAGPGLGGLLIQLVGAAKTLSVDAFSFVVSVATLAWIRRSEAAAPPTPELPARGRPGLVADLREGLELVFSNPILRNQLVALTLLALGFHLIDPVLYVWAYRDLHLTPAILGLTFTFAGGAGLIGAMLSAAAVRLVGLGRLMAGCLAVAAVAFLLLPTAAVLPPAMVFFSVFFLVGLFDQMFNINQVSLRQGLTPNRLQGRMNASFRTIFWGAWPLANLIGGVLGSSIGPIPTILLGGSVGLLSAVAVAVGPIGRLRQHPSAAPVH
jgi:predicted MFS family arabinose efflux permease